MFKTMSNVSSPPADTTDEKTIGDKNAIVSSISWFCNNEEMSDIVLKLGAERFHAHKFVLVLMSDVFRTMCSKRWDHDNVNELELSECNECIPVFPKFLHFLYHGTVSVKTATALPLLMLADKYNVKPLKLSCEKYIQTQVEVGNVAGAIRWLPYLQLCGHKELEKECIDVIITQMELVLSQHEFLLLGIELLSILLERNDLVVLCEYSLYQGVVKWIESHDNKELSKHYLKTLLPLLRFPMMFPEQLLMIESSEFYQSNSDIISPYLALAHRFRSLVSEVVDNTFLEALYRPRNYTHSLWCQFVNLGADHASFFGKTIKLSTTNDLLNSSLRSQEPNWQIQIINDKQDGNGGVKIASSCDTMSWRLRGPSSFAVSSAPTLSVPLQMSIKPLKPLRPNLVVDVSMFMVKKDSLYKHLDTATVSFTELDSGSQPQIPITNHGFTRATQAQGASIFQPSPMHFTFTTLPTPVENDTFLRHRFSRDDFEHPAEVPCVSFGPHFASLPRPCQSVRVALIMKPRFRTPTEPASGCTENEKSDQDASGVYDLPLLG
uniref:Uncharacterized protein LOC100187381 n=1 Tax=Phallusia mammillata TaxID=59560 RepID=A0A6F9DJA4_9ASCI|nr:uncharacterized protein LOC100187381 [Phallusia mammillata]